MIGKLTNDPLLTRAALAKALGVSVQEVQRRLRTGSLIPHTHRGNEPMFTYGQLQEQRMLSRKRIAPTTSQAVEEVHYNGEDAAVVFSCLDENMTLPHIVMHHKIHPDAVMAAARAYQRMQGGLMLSGSFVSRLEKLPLDGEFPVQTENQLLEMLQSALTDTACSECQKRTRKVCLACARSLARKGKPSVEVETDD